MPLPGFSDHQTMNKACLTTRWQWRTQEEIDCLSVGESYKRTVSSSVSSCHPHLLTENRDSSFQAPTLGLVLTLPLLPHLLATLWGFCHHISAFSTLLYSFRLPNTVSPVTRIRLIPQCSSVRPEHSLCALSQGHSWPT